MAFTFRRVCTYIVNIANLLFALKSQFLKSVPNIVKVSKLDKKKFISFSQNKNKYYVCKMLKSSTSLKRLKA